MDAREAPFQGRKGIGGVLGAEPGLDRGHMDAGMVGKLCCLAQALGQGRHADDRLQRVLGRDQPPHLVELEAPECDLADVAVAGMGGVEGAAEEPHPRPWRPPSLRI